MVLLISSMTGRSATSSFKYVEPELGLWSKGSCLTQTQQKQGCRNSLVHQQLGCPQTRSSKLYDLFIYCEHEAIGNRKCVQDLGYCLVLADQQVLQDSHNYSIGFFIFFNPFSPVQMPWMVIFSAKA